MPAPQKGIREPVLLKGHVQHYAWGSVGAIPSLLGLPNPEGRPFAELWLGAHPAAPSLALASSGPIGLDRLIAADPEGCLGEGLESLPFLLKLLSAASPLSIQAHPSRAQAERGFEREEAAGLPLDSPQRLYKDRNHKPEIIAALGPFKAMCGFREPAETARLFDLLEGVHPALDSLALAARRAAGGAGIETLFRAILDLAPEERFLTVQAARARALELGSRSGQAREEAMEVLIGLSGHYPEDLGIFAPLYLNLLRLDRLDALFIPQGTLHAYLEGTGVELMANSDNVLRGGLSPKRVDPEELARILDFRPFRPSRLRPLAGPSGWAAYPVDCADFGLAVLDAAQGGAAVREGGGPEILCCCDGGFRLTQKKASLELGRGGAGFIPAASGAYELGGRGLAFRASLPSGPSN